jgi:4-hydroxy-tetrahydrodipicolinate synthase
VNDALLPVYAAIMGGGQGAMMVKAALHALGLPAGPTRPPLVDATPEEVAQLRRQLVAGGLAL